MAETTAELLTLNQRLLDCIADGDWATYQELCDPTLTAIEPESHGQRVEGLAFHRFYFDLGGIRGRHQTTMADPHVRLLGDVAVLPISGWCRQVGPDGQAMTSTQAETRVWQRRDGRWWHVHLHRVAARLIPAASARYAVS